MAKYCREVRIKVVKEIENGELVLLLPHNVRQ